MGTFCKTTRSQFRSHSFGITKMNPFDWPRDSSLLIAGHYPPSQLSGAPIVCPMFILLFASTLIQVRRGERLDRPFKKPIANYFARFRTSFLRTLQLSSSGLDRAFPMQIHTHQPTGNYLSLRANKISLSLTPCDSYAIKKSASA